MIHIHFAKVHELKIYKNFYIKIYYDIIFQHWDWKFSNWFVFPLADSN
jgi:hypothetical protein